MPTSPPASSPRTRLALVAILLIAGVLRYIAAPIPGGLAGGLDREMDGFQAAFFTLTSVNYARLGPMATGGYPVVNLELDAGAPKTWYTYANHPPGLALFFWLELELLGPKGWSAAPARGEPPTSVQPGAIERLLRAPMWLASMASILALFWALRGAMGEHEALIATLFYATIPLAVLDAGLVNYEPPSILFVLIAFGASIRFLESETRWHLTLAALALALGASLTFAPLFFAVPLCLFVLVHRLRRRGLSAAICTTSILAFAALAPILLHGIWAHYVLSSIGQVPQLTDRIGQLFGPLLDGSVPLFAWAKLQFTHLSSASSELFRDLVLLGILLSIVDLLAAPKPNAASGLAAAARARAAAFALLLFTGGAAVLFFYYRHTSDGFLSGTSAQTTFMLNLLPGASALAAVAIFEVVTTLARVFQKGRTNKELSPLARHGPVVLGAALILLSIGSFSRTTAASFAAWRAPDPARPLPLEVGTELSKLLPPGSVGLYPATLGLTPAVSLYAWRTLLPVTADVPSIEFTQARITAAGLAKAPRYLLLPKEPHDEGTKALATFFQKMSPAAAQEPTTSPNWRAWRLNENAAPLKSP